MTALNASGSLFVWNPLSSGAAERLPVPISRTPRQKFNPHGIDVVGNNLFVTNLLIDIQDHDQVEVYSIAAENGGKIRLAHLQSVLSPLMTGYVVHLHLEFRSLVPITVQDAFSLGDVVALDSTKFYVSNTYRFRGHAFRMGESVLGLDTGSILYFDGTNTRAVITGLGAPVGLCLERHKR